MVPQQHTGLPAQKVAFTELAAAELARYQQRFGYGKRVSIKSVLRRARHTRLPRFIRSEAWQLAGHLFQSVERYVDAVEAYKAAIRALPKCKPMVLVDLATAAWTKGIDDAQKLLAAVRLSQLERWQREFYWDARLQVASLTYDADELSRVIESISHQDRKSAIVSAQIMHCRHLVLFWRREWKPQRPERKNRRVTKQRPK
jgi:hypothetical protein